MIYIGADHRGFSLKQKLFQRLKAQGFDVCDLGNDRLDPDDDYPDFAKKVAEATASSAKNKGIILCGSGEGVNMVANKIPRIRAALGFNIRVTKQAREHENANVLALPAGELDLESAWEITKTFLTTPFSEEFRHARRVQEIKELDN